MYICMYWKCVFVSWVQCPQRTEKGIRSLRGRITCDLNSQVDAGDWTQVLCKSSNCSHPLRHLSSSPICNFNDYLVSEPLQSSLFYSLFSCCHSPQLVTPACYPSAFIGCLCSLGALGRGYLSAHAAVPSSSWTCIQGWADGVSHLSLWVWQLLGTSYIVKVEWWRRVICLCVTFIG